MQILRNVLFSATTSIGAIAVASLSVPVMAQTVPSPAVRQPVDENGVDVAHGNFNFTTTDVSIGNGEVGMSYVRSHDGAGWRDNMTGSLNFDGVVMTVSLGDGSETFTYASGAYTSDQGSGSTFAANGTAEYIYTRSDGMVAVFASSNGAYGRFGNAGYVKSITYNNGLKWTFNTTIGQWCQDANWTGSSCTVPTTGAVRVQSVTNNAGYQIKLNYATNSLTNYSSLASWYQVSKATGINNAVEYCDPVADSCALSGAWPYMSYSLSGQTETDTAPTGAQRVITYDALGRIGSLKRPTAATATTTVTYGADGKVSSITNEGVVSTYSWVDSGNIRMLTRANATSGSVRFDTHIATGAITTVFDGAGKSTSTIYDAKWRPYQVISHEGNLTQYTYDARGNVTEVRSKAKTPGSPADIVTTAGYDGSCTYIKICNQPIWTRDALNNQTDYTYDPNHGGTLTVTLPAASVGGTRPQTRYTYSSPQAYYKNSSGAIVASGQPITLLTETSACMTGSACAGTANESKTTINYGPQVAGTGNNLLPESSAVSAGDGSTVATTTVTYDAAGNVTTIDGPLPGTADTRRLVYDSRRAVVGEILPAPAAGQPNPATRVTFNGDGAPTKVESGTTNGQTDPAWQAFVSVESVETAYDANGRVITKALKSGGASYALTQISYDNGGRVDCTAVRMNIAAYASLPASACTLGNQGTDGPDRIDKTTYDAAGRVATVTRAFATAEPAVETIAYTDNGKTSNVVDGRGNRTTYEYDGHDRLDKIRYPVTTANTSTSSTTDYEQFTYDAKGNILVRRLRDGNTITMTYDNLGRSSSSSPTGEFTVNYGYDLFGNVTQVQRPGDGMSVSANYDALGRRLSETQPNGTMTYAYYEDSRLKRIIWPDSNFVGYEYDYLAHLIHRRCREGLAGVV